jgi:hypothetical protein
MSKTILWFFHNGENRYIFETAGAYEFKAPVVQPVSDFYHEITGRDKIRNTMFVRISKPEDRVFVRRGNDGGWLQRAALTYRDVARVLDYATFNDMGVLESKGFLARCAAPPEPPQEVTFIHKQIPLPVVRPSNVSIIIGSVLFRYILLCIILFFPVYYLVSLFFSMLMF